MNKRKGFDYNIKGGRYMNLKVFLNMEALKNEIVNVRFTNNEAIYRNAHNLTFEESVLQHSNVVDVTTSEGEYYILVEDRRPFIKQKPSKEELFDSIGEVVVEDKYGARLVLEPNQIEYCGFLESDMNLYITLDDKNMGLTFKQWDALNTYVEELKQLKQN